jgi:ribosome biogenesis SPOUT family RNA methylase Rps3
MSKTYIVEHLDPELGPWSALEYQTIAEESLAAGSSFVLSSVSPQLKLPNALLNTSGFRADTKSVEELHAATKSRVCLLDPAAKEELSPTDGEKFDVFLFGGILGNYGKGIMSDLVALSANISIHKKETTLPAVFLPISLVVLSKFEQISDSRHR